MFRGGERFNEHICYVILEACGSLEERRGGEQIHGFVVKSGLHIQCVCGHFIGVDVL